MHDTAGQRSPPEREILRIGFRQRPGGKDVDIGAAGLRGEVATMARMFAL